MRWKVFLLVVFFLLLTACGRKGLNQLILSGPELHTSLVTQDIEMLSHLHVDRSVLQGNPQLSTDREFIEAIARSGSQGRLSGEGIRAALYALYRGENEVGFYGLEAVTTGDADRRERLLREIWAHNASLNRARVHRGGKVLVVVWNDGVSTSCWESVNRVVAERLAGL